MRYTFSVSPDFTPDRFAGWFIFNTWLQKQTDMAIHLEMHHSFELHQQAIAQDKIDLVYANPYNAAMLVREKGFLPIVKPLGITNEAVIAVNVDSHVNKVTDFSPNIKIATTDDPDIRLMGMIMLEPADLDANNTTSIKCDSYAIVAKQLLIQYADAGIFLASAYDNLSSVIKKHLKVVVRSEISVVHHCLMSGPKLANQRDAIQALLLDMSNLPKGRGVLTSLHVPAWQEVDNETMEFLIDLMDTLEF